jgi:capsular polysaccharide transport system permease protein
VVQSVPKRKVSEVGDPGAVAGEPDARPQGAAATRPRNSDRHVKDDRHGDTEASPDVLRESGSKGDSAPAPSAKSARANEKSTRQRAPGQALMEDGAASRTAAPVARAKSKGAPRATPGSETGTTPPPVGKPASPARFRGRHRNLVLSLILVVLLPVLASAAYLTALAEDQYASTTGFTIRQAETESASALLGGLTQMFGGANVGNADLLFEFLQSQEIVERIDERIDLRAHYSTTWPSDPIFSIWPDSTVEDLLSFWRRMVRVTYNQSSGLIVIQVRARDAVAAREIAQAIVTESESMINMLNETARRDSMANAEADLAEALERLRSAREEMVEFRARTQILDPMADIQGRMGVLNNLQQQLAQALVDYDLLLHTAESGDPRVRQAVRRIDVIRDRIAEERRSFAAQDVTVEDTDYPQLLAQYEGLRVNQEFAEQSYGAALTAFDVARSNAERQQLYLASFIRPTLAQRAEYPQRLLLIGLTALFSMMVWAIGALVYYSLRDRG